MFNLCSVLISRNTKYNIQQIILNNGMRGKEKICNDFTAKQPQICLTKLLFRPEMLTIGNLQHLTKDEYLMIHYSTQTMQSVKDLRMLVIIQNAEKRRSKNTITKVACC